MKNNSEANNAMKEPRKESGAAKLAQTAGGVLVHNGRTSLLHQVPNELRQMILGHLSFKDTVNYSSASRNDRNFFNNGRTFKNAALDWHERNLAGSWIPHPVTGEKFYNVTDHA